MINCRSTVLFHPAPLPDKPCLCGFCQGKKELEIRLPSCDNAVFTHTLGKFYVKRVAKHHGQNVYAISFPDDAQPVLLFTDNHVLASQLRRAWFVLLCVCVCVCDWLID